MNQMTMKNLNNKLYIGEGNTPLVRLFNMEMELNWRGQIWAKCEYQNPTGSFKDRGSVTEITEALAQNKTGIVCASTGNMAASLSAYAARTNLTCWVIVPKETPQGKIRQALANGAQVIKVEGNYDTCVYEAEKLAQSKNALLCGDYVTRRKGQRMIGKELSQSQIKFDAYIVPVGNGTLGCAIYEGFASYDKYPQFIGVQGQGADPLFQAWKYDTAIEPISKPTSIASAINVGNPLDGALTIEYVNKSNGVLFSVSDEEIIAAQKLLSTTEGIYVEKSAAATVTALISLPSSISQVVLILTGSGLKEN